MYTRRYRHNRAKWLVSCTHREVWPLGLTILPVLIPTILTRTYWSYTTVGLGAVPARSCWPFCTAWDYLLLKISCLVFSDLSLSYRLDEVCCL